MIYQDSRFLVLQTNHYSYVISLNAPAPLGIYWGPKIDARDAECLHPLNDRSSLSIRLLTEERSARLRFRRSVRCF